MAVGFPRPFDLDYQVPAEKANFERFFVDRNIPAKGPNEIDLASWNIANLGLQPRTPDELELVAHILSKFDITAVQEVHENLGDFEQVMGHLPAAFDMRMTDTAGSSERLAVVYRTDLLRPRQLFGELDYNPRGKIVNGRYRLEPKKQSFSFQGEKLELLFYNFNRNPFLSTWEVVGRDTSFLLANVHIYFGDDDAESAKFQNRVSEVFFLAKWAQEQRKKVDSEKLYENNIILIGDMNVPKMRSDNPVYRALKRRGMQPSKYSTATGTTIQEFNTFDQIVFTNDQIEAVEIGGSAAVVVDFDNFMFPDLWSQVQDPNHPRDLTDFKAWTKYAISDHRPLLVRLRV